MPLSKPPLRLALLVLALALWLAFQQRAPHRAVAQARPQFNPTSFQCSSYPQGPVMQGSWQTSAPREVDAAGDSVQIGLRNKNGNPGETYEALATVWGPDGTESATLDSVTVSADNWTYLDYPDDFDDNADTDLPGTYTILWTIGPLNVACDGFVLR